MSTTYQQPEKKRVRRRVLQHAVRALTSERHRSPVVRPDELEAVVKYSIDVLGRMGRRDLEVGIQSELERWLVFQEGRVSSRDPGDLRVVYLCGHEPLNDLDVLLELGVNPHNIWAVESNENAYIAACKELADANVPLKVHRGPLAQFFDRVSETFDIAYLDSTGPLLGGRPSALLPVLQVLQSLRLEPLSVLVTNFAAVPETEVDRYSQVMSDFFRYRHNDMPRTLFDAGIDPAIAEYDAVGLPEAIRANLESVYSDFISRLLIDIGRSWIPNARGFRVVEKQYLAERSTSGPAIDDAFSTGAPARDFEEYLQSVGDVHLSPSAYPLVSFHASMREANGAEPLANQLADLRFGGRDALSLNRAVALLDKIAEGHWSMASDELLRAIASPWFDRDSRFSCDLPFPNLLVNSILGIYGQPSFPSLRDTLRGTYTAKKTPMFIDALLLDRCRYYFDWFPLAAQLPERFRSEPIQVVARCLMDRIWSSDGSPDSHPFRGSSVAGFGDLRSAPFHWLRDRETWS